MNLSPPKNHFLCQDKYFGPKNSRGTFLKLQFEYKNTVKVYVLPITKPMLEKMFGVQLRRFYRQPISFVLKIFLTGFYDF